MAAIPLAFGLLCALLLASVQGQQDAEPAWHWIMADSRNASLVCPGRCLTVNDSAYPGDYQDKEVAFGPCSSTSTSSDSTSSSNNNQQWLYDGPGSPTRIRINASEADPPVLLCLQPRRSPGSPQLGLTVAKCAGESNRNQSWIVANDSIASLGFDPPLYLAMNYELAGDWRRASLVPTNTRNRSLTAVLSAVAYTEDPRALPELNISNMPADSANFLQNGGFENSSLDFRRGVAEREIEEDDLFGVCHWSVLQSEVQLLDGNRMPPAEGNRTLLLNGGRFQQIARTRRGAMYTLAFKIAVASPDSSSSSSSSGGEACNGTESVSVNSFPSTNVRVNLNTRSRGAWEAKHFSLQAVGPELQVRFEGCSTCGCYLDDVNLMQTSDPMALPSPPPLRPIPPPPPPDDPLWSYLPRRPPPAPENNTSSPASTKPKPAPENNTSSPASTKPKPAPWHDPVPRPPLELAHQSGRLSNGAVAGLLVGSSVLFFLIGASCFAVLGLTKQPKAVEEVQMARPAEWSIQTSTPPRSEGLAGSKVSASAAANPLPSSNGASSRP